MFRRSRWTAGALSALLILVAVALPPRPSAESADDPASSAVLTTLLREFVVNEFTEITPGQGKFPKSFRMGSPAGPASEQPVHEVTFAYRFRIEKTEVPQNLYAAVMGSNPSRWKGPRNSAEMFTHGDAVEFCRRLTRLLRDPKLIGADEEIRLPSEAEWEYCCRAGTTTVYSFGDTATRASDTGTKASLLDEYAWHTGNAEGNDPPAGAKKHNPWDLYDMHGYLSEFVADAWHDNYKGAPTDGSAWTGSDAKAPRVLRGGSWKDHFEDQRSSIRRSVDLGTADPGIGFRCVIAKVVK